MTRRILAVPLAVLAFALIASPASAHKAPHRYSPRHGAKCRKHYKRVRHGHKVFCVRKAVHHRHVTPAAPGPAPKVTLHAHLDPTFVRNPLDPFEVRYAYSASATQTTAPTGTMSLATTEAPAPLPAGVLALYSDGKLECAVNVGPGVEGSECPVTYQALGEHRVTTLYASGEQSATETEVEHIGPLATTTTLSVSYVPISVQQGEEVEPGTGLYHLGDLTVAAGASPSSLSAHLGCGEGSVEHLTTSGCYGVESTTEHVYGNIPGACLQSVYISKETEWTRIESAEQLHPKNLEEGIYHLRASITASGGYSGSEATAPIQFKPEVTFVPDC